MNQSVDRALRALTYLAEGPCRISDLARHLEVHDSTVLRLLQALQAHRFVTRDSSKRYRIASGVYYIAQRSLNTLDLRTAAEPELDRLHTTTTETIHLATLEAWNVVYIDKREATHAVRVGWSSVGRVTPPHATAVGKAILAHLDSKERSAVFEGNPRTVFTGTTLTTDAEIEQMIEATRRAGFAVDNQEHQPGVHCIAAPIFGHGGKVEGSISVSAPASRLSMRELTDLAPELKRSAHEVSSALGWTPHPFIPRNRNP